MKGETKYKLILGDLHMGTGYIKSDGSPNPFEAFHEDEKLIEFLEYHMQEYEEYPVEIIFNGDTFDMVSVDDGRSYPSIVKESTSVETLDRILNAHRNVFLKLREFSKRKGNSVTFITGERDAGIIWPECSALLKDYISPKTKVVFGIYRTANYHIEHGNQYETINRFNPEMMFIYRKGERLLNLPYGPFFIKGFITRIKTMKPYIDRVHPFSSYMKWAFYFDTTFALRFIFGSAWFFLKTRLMPHPLRYSRFSNTIRIVKETLRKRSLENIALKILEHNPALKGVIMSHTHRPEIKVFKDKRIFIETGSWLETVNFEIGHLGRRKTLSYVELKVNELNSSAKLMVWRGKEHPVADLKEEF